VEERDHRRDPVSEEVVDELDVEVEAGLVDRVVAASQRDDAGPRDGEAVALGAGLLQQLNVLVCAVVRVAGDITAVAAGNLARDLAECVPY
jgi:hypothetical protein